MRDRNVKQGSLERSFVLMNYALWEDAIPGNLNQIDIFAGLSRVCSNAVAVAVIEPGGCGVSATPGVALHRMRRLLETLVCR